MGAHYTSEKNILKTIEPLFLDELRAEFEAAKRHPEALRAFHDKIADLRFFDPACGCGNFLIVAYREMRLLEIDVLRALYPAQEKRDIPIERLCRIDVDHFYGIEVERFPARIATAAMWLTDHQMNRKASAEMGEYFARIPLAKSPHISEENALRRNWREILPPDDNVFVFGNPPFVGYGNIARRNSARIWNWFSAKNRRGRKISIMSARGISKRRSLFAARRRGRLLCRRIRSAKASKAGFCGRVFSPKE